MTARTRLVLVAIAAAALAAAVYWALSRGGVLEVLSDPERLHRIVEDLGPSGPLAVVLMLAAAIVFSPIPSAPIALVAGAAYGKLWGTVYILAGAELGALVAFGISRRFGYGAVRRWPWAVRLLDRPRSQTALMAIVFVSRLLPFLSFDAISYVAGLTPLIWWRFALATLAGVTPVSIALVWFGDRMATVGSDWVLWGVLLLGGVTLVPLGVRALWARRRRSSQESPRGRRP